MTISSSRHYDVIVLGAGMSGLSCASRLYEHDRFKKDNSLLVLEARNRIGGRIESVNVNGSRLDTGANWIHGTGTKREPNPLVEILPHKKYREVEGGVSFRVPPTDNRDKNGAVNGHRDNDLVIPSKYSGFLQAARWGVIGELYELATSISAEDAVKTTIARSISRLAAFQTALTHVPEDMHSTISGYPQFIENMEAAPMIESSSEHARTASGVSLAEYAIDGFGGDQAFLRDGYTPIVEEVAKDLLKAGLIELDTPVRRVRWNETPIVIETSSNQSFTANQVVCTLPLGVLQKAQHILFSPRLPPPTATAIDSLGFGTLDKIFLVYSKPWWENEPFADIVSRGYQPGNDEPMFPDTFSGFTAGLQGLSVSASGDIASGPRLISCMNLQNLTGFPVLSAFVSCANALQVERMTDTEAGDLLQRTLASWFGVEPPKPDAVHVSRWAQDDFSRGSYSHMIAGLSEHAHREEFQRPARSGGGASLRFAGEHTVRDDFATVHGALLSGRREADAILKEMSN